jgi:predicted aspartyl protease
MKHGISDVNPGQNYPRRTEETRRAYCQIAQRRKGPMIQVGAEFNGRWMTALIDSGSSENFISEKLVQEIGAKVKTHGNITIERFDGTEAKYMMKTTTLRYGIRNVKFQDDFRVIPVGTGCEVILGRETRATLLRNRGQ